MTCKNCNSALTFNEIGLNKKYNGNAKGEPLCIACLAEKLGVSVRRLQEKIEEFLGAGCMLFVPEDFGKKEEE